MLYLNGKFDVNDKLLCGDKSITHRAMILAAIADGVSTINNACICRDTLSTAQCLRKLGADVEIDGTTVTVRPIVRPNDGQTLDCGNSATTARLIAGLVCGLNVSARFVGDASLSARSMYNVVKPLSAMGADIRCEKGCLFCVSSGGKLIGKTFKIAPSAQVKSAILIAGLFAEGTTTVLSAPSRNHTELLFRNMGAQITVSDTAVSVKKCRLHAVSTTVPGDFSAAAYLIATGLSVGTTLHSVGVNPTRTGMLTVLQNSGAKITLSNQKEICGEIVADITIEKSNLSPLFMARQIFPLCVDELPLMAAIAAGIKGKSVFCGVSELRNKECDRAAAAVTLCRSLGQEATFDGDTLTVSSDGNPVCQDVCFAFSDHRMAMTCAYVSTVAKGCAMDDYACVSVSCPDFFDIMGAKFHRFALIGEDISQSLSPLLFYLFAKECGISVSYDLVQLSGDSDEKVLKDAIARFDAVNVTSPFKRKVASLYGKSSVNCVFGGSACSTDGTAVINTLKYFGIDVRGKKLLVVGAGGAAESAIESLLSAGAEVSVVNRTAENAAKLTRKYHLSDNSDSPYGILSFVPPCRFEDSVPISGAKFVFSAEYKRKSSLIERAKACNIPAIDGRYMLYFQAKESFRLFTGANPPDCLAEFLQRSCKQ